jgi:glycosyltransferase involved in cell wall biosynthesis
MHIGVLTHNYPRFDGDFSGIFIEALCQELANQQQRLTVWAPYDPAYERPVNLEQPQPCTPALRLYRYIWPARLHRLGYMRSMQSDLALKLESYALSPFFFASGIATVLHQAKLYHPDVLHAHWLLPNGFIGAIVSRCLGIPLAVSVPGSDAQVASANPLFSNMARFALRQAKLITANSAELRDAVLALAGGAQQSSEGREWLKKFDLIIYGTDSNRLRPDSAGCAALRQQWAGHEQASTTILLCVGRMAPKKGFDVLIRALAEPALRQRKVMAVMIGKGDEWQAWQDLARHLGVDGRICWLGVVSNTEIGRYYNACDILVMPSVSRPADGLNVCVLDAMSCAKPVVTSNVAGNPLAVIDGQTGRIVPEQMPALLAEALAELIDDGDLRRRMGLAARQRIENELGWPALARRYIKHFETIIASNR